MSEVVLGEWRLLAVALLLVFGGLVLLLIRFIHPRALYGVRHVHQLAEARKLFLRKLEGQDVPTERFVHLLSRDFRHESVDENRQVVLTRVSRIRELFRLLSPARQDLPRGMLLPSVALCVTELAQIIGNMSRRLRSEGEYDYDLVPAHIVLSSVAEKIEEKAGGVFRFTNEREIEEWFGQHPISIEQVVEILSAVVFALAIRERVADPGAPGRRQSKVDFWSRSFVGSEGILRLIEGGEGKTVEFKSTLRRNLHTGSVDANVELEVFRAISGFLNTEGGTVLVGVSDDGVPCGYDSELFNSEDKVKRYVGDKVRSFMRGAELLVESSVHTIAGKEVVKIDCRPSRKPIYFKMKAETLFYVRTDAATLSLDVSQALEYIGSQFGV